MARSLRIQYTGAVYHVMARGNHVQPIYKDDKDRKAFIKTLGDWPMARQLRVQYCGAVYHVLARGNDGQPIFKQDKDRETFIETLAEACDKARWRVYAYVVMSNHYPLLLQTPEPNLVDGMKWLQGTYTQRFNGRHKVFGHLFQGRYKALIMDPQEANYVQFVSTYIHLNPVRAGLVEEGRNKLRHYR